jgi:Domain of unknown function (DUF4936)
LSGPTDLDGMEAAAAPHGLQVYVYYKVPSDDLAAAVQAAQALQAQWRAALPGLQCSLLRRPERRDGQVTLMETYAGPLPPDFEPRLASAAAAFAALPAARVVERFVPLG